MTTVAPILKPIAAQLAREERAAEPKLEVMCSWCQELYGWPNRPGITHGICAEHLAIMRRQVDELFQATKPGN